MTEYIELGVDYSTDHPTTGQIKAADRVFVFRYLAHTAKGLTIAEAETLWAAKLPIGLYYETTALAPLGGASTGHAHAADALKLKQGLGFPVSLPVHFSVDFNATSVQMHTVEEYFAQLNADSPKGTVGAYGGYNQVRDLFAKNLISSAVQTYAWSNGNQLAEALVQQYSNGHPMGAGTVDYLGSLAKDIPVWMPGMGQPTTPKGDHAPGTRTLKVTPTPMKGADVLYVQKFIGSPCGAADGVYGQHTKAGVEWYQHMRGITVDGIVGPQTWSNMGVKYTAK